MMMIKNIFLIGLGIFAIVLLVGCSNNDEQNKTEIINNCNILKCYYVSKSGHYSETNTNQYGCPIEKDGGEYGNLDLFYVEKDIRRCLEKSMEGN